MVHEVCAAAIRAVGPKGGAKEEETQKNTPTTPEPVAIPEMSPTYKRALARWKLLNM